MHRVKIWPDEYYASGLLKHKKSSPLSLILSMDYTKNYVQYHIKKIASYSRQWTFRVDNIHTSFMT